MSLKLLYADVRQCIASGFYFLFIYFASIYMRVNIPLLVQKYFKRSSACKKQAEVNDLINWFNKYDPSLFSQSLDVKINLLIDCLIALNYHI